MTLRISSAARASHDPNPNLQSLAWVRGPLAIARTLSIARISKNGLGWRNRPFRLLGAELSPILCYSPGAGKRPIGTYDLFITSPGAGFA